MRVSQPTLPAFGKRLSYDERLDQDWIRGVTDVHLHGGPDVYPRLYDMDDVVEQAQNAGMSGVTLKDHWEPTTSVAKILQKRFPGIKIYSGVALNYGVGGLNPNAVDLAKAKGSEFVWGPTVHAANHEITCHALGGFPFQMPTTERVVTEGITTLGEDGRLKPEMKEILDLMNGSGMVFATGHMSKKEIAAVIHYAKENKLDLNILVNHACYKTTRLSVRDVLELTGPRVWFETVFLSVSPVANAKQPGNLARLIMKTSEAKWIEASDVGQAANPPTQEAMLRFSQILNSKGVPFDKLERMAKREPLALLQED